MTLEEPALLDVFGVSSGALDLLRQAVDALDATPGDALPLAAMTDYMAMSLSAADPEMGEDELYRRAATIVKSIDDFINAARGK